ncbi:GNAT family N-acetyltransferase [Saccharibacillus sp. JS10]|uniref:GNAT family N-acetyltransferase n=1 Tax=Saccharibacillus sp. JS10 TaxID=2950552 RepID=UPI00210B354F|nr:GNAT family N-acetyltransferase [Saccharibacillus sp. JS10]MCQ4085363.1 GNAT family N-acetyltransferase [Saccharibacillus sp. JS10]
MSLTTEDITKQSSILPWINQLYEEAFPANERAPLSILLRKARKPFVEFIAYFKNGSPIGFVYLARDQELVYLMYLAIDSTQRSQGYGSEILEQLRNQYPNDRIVLNIEFADPNSPNLDERLRRRNFYVRNGYTGSGFLVKEFGVWYEALVCGGTIDREHYLKLYLRFMGFPLSLLARPKIVPTPDVPHLTDESKTGTSPPAP